MNKNVGGLDRLFRIGVGLFSLAVAYATEDMKIRLIFGAVAVIGLGTAAVGYCPLNQMFNLNTVKKKEQK